MHSRTVIRANTVTLPSKGTLPKKIVSIIFGNFLGIFLNLLAAFSLFHYAGFAFTAAFFSGIAIQILCNLALEKLITSFGNIAPKIEFHKIALMSVTLALPAFIIAWFLADVLGLFYGISLLVASFSYMIFYLVLVGLWIFVDDDFDEVYYPDLAEDYFDASTDKKTVGFFRAWAHTSRFDNTAKLFDKYYKAGQMALDYGCGSSTWNIHKKPLYGVDINEQLLRYGIGKGRLKNAFVTDIYQTGFRENSVDLVVCSQVLEHLKKYKDAVREVRRILKPGGIFIAEVPYDILFGPYFFLFNIHCFIKGYWFDDPLYRNRCGHINHFSRRSLRKLLEENGFRLKEIYIFNGLILSAVGVKENS
ncbi:MAG: class I SAM-dependent methyltransferase [Candidatus Omnitrophica bacterium]|nr:class I SAM-dependent methyltransferase [Candidatus Omnitrophota bacterium]